MTDIFEHHCAATYLRGVLDARRVQDPGYSLRSLARCLTVSPAHLSHFLNKKKNVSVTTGLKIARRLELGPRETEYFCLLVQLNAQATTEIRDSLTKRMLELVSPNLATAMEADHLRTIKEWYHIAILEMTYLDKCDMDPETIARRLEIDAHDAQEALDRLHRLGLLTTTDDGRVVKSELDTVFRSAQKDEAYAHFHQQMIMKAIGAMHDQGFDERFITSQTFCLDPVQIPEAKTIVRDFMRQMAALHDSAPQRQHVYQMNVQLFNLTKD